MNFDWTEDMVIGEANDLENQSTARKRPWTVNAKTRNIKSGNNCSTLDEKSNKTPTEQTSSMDQIETNEVDSNGEESRKLRHNQKKGVQAGIIVQFFEKGEELNVPNAKE